VLGYDASALDAGEFSMPSRALSKHRHAVVALLGFVAAEAPAVSLGEEIVRAPAFDARDLTAWPRASWITNGGNVYNQRYSPLTRINRDNVAELKALWRTAMGSGANPRNSGQAQILAYEGVLYVVNGENDVFALDVETGAILWTYHGQPAPGSGNPLG
jgi:glucose dehydrogenase